jgi:Protein of unknown function (DUF1573).
MRLLPYVAFVLALLVSAAVLRAGLEFETTVITLEPKSGEKTIATEFKFKNTGDTPVVISEVRSGCGCTVPKKPDAPVGPGASGVIPVAYKPGGREGMQSQAIEVETVDGQVHRLRLVIDVPVRVRFAPRLLRFEGDERGPKMATLTYEQGGGTELRGVAVQSSAFEVVGEPAIENQVLKLAIRYVGPADAEARASVRIQTRDTTGSEHADILYLRHSPGR